MGKCEYCKDAGYQAFLIKYEPAYDKGFFLDVQDGQLVMDVSLPTVEYIKRVNINFCPMCGRPLSNALKDYSPTKMKF